MKIAFLTDNYMPGRWLDPFRALLLKTAIQTSSELLYVQCNDYLGRFAVVRGSRGQAHIIKSLTEFAPDLIFSLNRAGLTAEVMNATKASIASWYIDNPDRFPGELRQFAKNEKVYCATRFQMDWLRLKHPEVSNLHYLPFCTDDTIFRPDANLPESSKCDVSFVGTLWDPAPFLEWTTQLNNTDEDRAFILNGMKEYQQNYLSDFPERLAQRLQTENHVQVKNYLNDFLSSRRRLAVLDRLSDLQLEIYGNSTWDLQTLLRGDALYQSFRLKPLETPEQLSALYRRTRVAISIAHQQAQTGFPIRVFDIFASGTPLVSDPHAEIDELFGEGLYLKSISPEAYSENVRRLLADKALAKKMSETALNEVRSRHTFMHRLGTIQERTLSRLPSGRVTVVAERFNMAALTDDPDLKAFQASRRMVRQAETSAPVSKVPMLDALFTKIRKIFTLMTEGTFKKVCLWFLFFQYLWLAFRKRRSPQSSLSFNRVAKSTKLTARQRLDALDTQIGRLTEEISILRKEKES